MTVPMSEPPTRSWKHWRARARLHGIRLDVWRVRYGATGRGRDSTQSEKEITAGCDCPPPRWRRLRSRGGPHANGSRVTRDYRGRAERGLRIRTAARPVRQPLLTGHSEHFGFLAVQTRAPSSIIA